MKALGLIERSGMLICGALPPEEMPRLALAKDLSVAEQRQLISWQDPPAWSAAASNDAPPGPGELHDQDRRAARDPVPGDAHQRPRSGCTTPTSSGTSRAAAASSLTARHADANGAREG